MMVFRFTRKTDCKLKTEKNNLKLQCKEKDLLQIQGVSTELLVNNAHEN